MTLSRRSKWKNVAIAFFSFLFIFSFCFILSYRSVENSKPYVPIFKTEHKVLFFYRDDCEECQSIFPYIYARNLFFRDTVFINLNEELNQRVYLRKYQLVSVPTFICGDKRYSGTEKKKIQALYSE